MCPPRPKVPKVLPNFPPATSDYEENHGYYFGMGDYPPQYGQIPVPNGKPGCLSGICFVASGTMPSLKREELKDLIEKYGGRLTNAISGGTDVLIRGCIEVGPKKLQEAKNRQLVIIDQESLFSVIAESSGAKPSAAPSETAKAVEVVSEPEAPAASLFADRYKPRSFAEFVGNDGPVNQLRKWLSNFSKSPKRIALVSGPPGVGKTTAIELLCEELKLPLNVFNASDDRSKNAIERLSVAADSLSFSWKRETIGKTVVVFDEVDGMGAGDRGGISAIAGLLKKTKVPIICICADSGDQKLEALARIALSIAFVRPTRAVGDIVKRLASICAREHIAMSEDQLNALVVSAGFDLRFCLNTLQFWGSGAGSAKDEQIPDVVQATLRVFSPKASLDEKIDAFFVDYNRIGSYIAENLPYEDRHSWADELESVAQGDVIGSVVYGQGSWGLLNAQCVVSALIPASLVKTPVESLLVPKGFRIASKQSKLERYHKEIALRTERNCGINHGELYDEVAALLAWKLRGCLTERTADVNGLERALYELGLTLDDVDHVAELGLFDEKNGPKVSEAVRKRFEQFYRKRHSDNQKKIAPESEVRSDYLFARSGRSQK